MSIDEQWDLGFDWFHVRDLTGDDFVESPLLSIKNGAITQNQPNTIITRTSHSMGSDHRVFAVSEGRIKY